jgi:hypothetical protein
MLRFFLALSAILPFSFGQTLPVFRSKNSSEARNGSSGTISAHNNSHRLAMA